MTVSTIKKVFPYPIQQVWNLMTSLDTYAWRSDISEIKVLMIKSFKKDLWMVSQPPLPLLRKNLIGYMRFLLRIRI